MDIERSINLFLDGRGKNKGRKPDERYAFLLFKSLFNFIL